MTELKITKTINNTNDNADSREKRGILLFMVPNYVYVHRSGLLQEFILGMCHQSFRGFGEICVLDL